MNSTLRTVVLLVMTCLLSSTVAASHDDTNNAYYAYGDVINAEPIIRQTTQRTPRTECHSVRSRNTSYQAARQNNALPTLFGGLLGGIIGHQFGGGNGKTALTIAGTFVGASIANNASHRPPHYRKNERCTVVRVVRHSERVEGYLVTYRYQGKQFTRTMDENPGSRVRIRIQVQPVDEAYATTYSSSDIFSSDKYY